MLYPLSYGRLYLSARCRGSHQARHSFYPTP